MCCEKMSRSSSICCSAASDRSLRKYVGKVAADMVYGLPSTTSTSPPLMEATPRQIISRRSLYGNRETSSFTGITTRWSTCSRAFSMRYLCPSVKGLAFITMTPVLPLPAKARRRSQYCCSPLPFSRRIALGASPRTWKPRLSKTALYSGLVNTFRLPRPATMREIRGTIRPSERAS